MGMKWLIYTTVFAIVAACGVTAPAPDDESSDEPSAVTVARVADDAVPPTDPALLRAAMTGDPEVMAGALAGLLCKGIVTCPPEYSSCGSWSAAATCGLTYCGNTCGKCPVSDPFCDLPQAKLQRTQFFRVCFNAQAKSCTEYQPGIPKNFGCTRECEIVIDNPS